MQRPLPWPTCKVLANRTVLAARTRGGKIYRIWSRIVIPWHSRGHCFCFRILFSAFPEFSYFSWITFLHIMLYCVFLISLFPVFSPSLVENYAYCIELGLYSLVFLFFFCWKMMFLVSYHFLFLPISSLEFSLVSHFSVYFSPCLPFFQKTGFAHP